MENHSTRKIYFPNNFVETRATVTNPSFSASMPKSFQYNGTSMSVAETLEKQIDSTIERVSKWFLNKSPMSNKKLQKLCYYAYCWFIVFFNDAEQVTESNEREIRTLCAERFQAWIHGPVSPKLYNYYKSYGWHDIPQVSSKPIVSEELELLLQQVWEAYGDFSADELEAISHKEFPWKNARKGIRDGEACANEISNYDILKYYSSLG